MEMQSGPNMSAWNTCTPFVCSGSSLIKKNNYCNKGYAGDFGPTLKRYTWIWPAAQKHNGKRCRTSQPLRERGGTKAKSFCTPTPSRWRWSFNSSSSLWRVLHCCSRDQCCISNGFKVRVTVEKALISITTGSHDSYQCTLSPSVHPFFSITRHPAIRPVNITRLTWRSTWRWSTWRWRG